MKRYIKEYKIEIISTLVVLIGILLVADFSTRDTIVSFIGTTIRAMLTAIQQTLEWIGSQVTAMTPADFFGGILIGVAAVFIVWRIRYRFQNDPRWSIDFCPKCSNPIMRMHRKLGDRVLGVTLFPEARRYRCVNPQCGWTGLLRRHVHRRRSRSEQVSGPQNLN